MIAISDSVFIDGDLPVLYLKRLDGIVMSDIHIGYEQDMAKRGIYIPNVQKKRFLSVYEKSLSTFNFKKLIINGDFKHTFEKLTKQEKDELSEILSRTREDGIEVKVIKGNHDNYISLVVEKFDNVELMDSMEVDNFMITHGHKTIEKKDDKTFILGHEHPRLSIRDRIGYVKRFQVFLTIPVRDSSSKIIVLPPVGTYQAGNDVTMFHSNYMSPLIRNYGSLENAKPYVIVEGEGIMEFPELKLLRKIII
jgi:putative SbcD/Mre11-related phosphoesterase